MELSVQIEPTSELSVLEKSIFIARHINSAIDVLRPLVYQVWKDELWKEKFSSFGEYVESPEGLNKSQGYASKLKQVEQFRLDSGFSEKEIAGVDYESIYLALKSGGTPEEILAKAKVLTRAELRQEQQETQPHPFEELVICKVCHGAKANHS